MLTDISQHYFRSTLLLTYIVHPSVVILSWYLIVEAIISSSLLLSFIAKHFYHSSLMLIFIVKRFYRYFLIIFDWRTTLSFYSFIDLLYKTLSSLFLFIYDCRSTSFVLLYRDLYFKTLLSLVSHHIWLLDHFYRSSLLLICIVKEVYRYFIFIFDCWVLL
jgi:hypothetical protein